MKKIDLGQTITILANVGVIAGIVFLAIELRQNNELLNAQVDVFQAQARETKLDRRVETLQLVATNPSLAEAIELYRASESLIPAQASQVEAYLRGVFAI